MKYNSIEEYYQKHSVCPNCKRSNLLKTDFEYIFSKKFPFKDKNSAECLKCRWCGIVDDLVEEINSPETESQKLYDEYYLNHKRCPNCMKSSCLIQTLAACFPDDKDFRDSNSCACECDWKGIIHELVK